MNLPDEIFQEIEADRAIREREIRLVKNCAIRSLRAYECDMFSRSTVLLTYAHLEGFCKFSFSTYVSAINRMKLACSNASYALVAASLTNLFAALRNPGSKHPVFARSLPDDSKLHLAAREREFVEKWDAIVNMRIELPDTTVDVESNLSSTVLKKNLFKLGLDYPIVDTQKPQLDKLLGIRNAIAHGDSLKIPTKHEIDEYAASAFSVMRFVQYEIFNALKNQAFLRRG
jgi:hypothetical protein